MQSERLSYRLRTTDLMRELLNMSKADQMSFFGMEEDGYLETELRRASNTISTNREISWRIFDLVDQQTGQVIGNCGYHTWWHDHHKAELGYWLNERSRRKGYMREALQTIIQYGFEEMKLHRLEANISPDNQASIGLVKSFGFQFEGLMKEVYYLDGQYYDSVHYALLKK